MIYQDVISLDEGISRRLLKKAAIVFVASILIGLTGWVAVPLPFTAVPITLQCHAALFAGLFLGRRMGFLAVTVFLIEGFVGLPVFSLGKSGPLILIGPTGGYLVGYPLGAWLTGYLIEKSSKKSALTSFLALIAGSVIIFALGAAWLSRFIGFERALLLGVAPFILGDVLNSLLVVKIARLSQGIKKQLSL
jgi:biotin transport system substrate-specific component